MKLTVLGSGTSIPHPHRASSGYWLETQGSRILLDCSAPVPNRLAEHNLEWHEIDSIWISHFHLDHCGGLPSLLAGTKHATPMKDRKHPLRIFGAAGISKLLENFSNVNNYRLFEQPFPIEVVEVEPLEPFEIATGITAVAMPTPHTDESHAIHLINDQGKTLVYTADTGFSETVAAFANGVDLLVIECSYPKDKPVEKHLELAEAIFLVRKASPKRAMLTHLYPEWDKLDVVTEAEKFEPRCEIIEARDGLIIEI